MDIWGAMREPNLPPREQTANEDARITVGNISPVYTNKIANVADIARKLKQKFNTKRGGRSLGRLSILRAF